MTDPAETIVDQVYRIHIPQPHTELTLGKDERGYIGLYVCADVHGKSLYQRVPFGIGEHVADVAEFASEFLVGQIVDGFSGIYGRAGSGSVFMGAGGGVFGLSEYGDITKSLAGMSLAIGSTMAIANFVDNLRRGWSDHSTVTQTLAVGKLLFAGAKDIYTGVTGTTPGAGYVQIYGDTSVDLYAPATVAMTTLGMASVNAGLSASLGGMVSSSVGGGIFASLYALYSASVSGEKVSVVGNASATLAARNGKAIIEGPEVLVGVASTGLDGELRAKGPANFKQQATRSVQISADEEFNVSLGPTPSGTLPVTRIRASKASVRLDTKDASLTVGETTRIVAGKSVADVAPDGITLARFATAPKTTFELSIEAAHVAYDGAVELANAAAMPSLVTDVLEVNTATLTIVGLLSAATALTGTIVGTAGKSDGTRAGAAIGAWVGAGYGVGLATAAVLLLVKKKARAALIATQIEAAAEARATAMQTAETALANATCDDAKPQIKLTDTEIILSVGETMLSLNKDGVIFSVPPQARFVAPGIDNVDGGLIQLGE